MRLYADVLGTEWPGELLEQVEGALASGLDPDRPAPSRIEAAREALIAAGMLEQGIADGNGDPDGGQQERSSAALTDRTAEILACLAAGGPVERALPAALAEARAALRGRGPISIVHPEGYLFYALFPDLYVKLGATIGAVIGNRPAVVIGVRSIGTSLSAAVATGLRAHGCAVQRHTVRPVGDPFSRLTIPSQQQRDAWQAAAARGASFIAVDEGPGLSGSSLASVIAALKFAEDRGRSAAYRLCRPPSLAPDGLPGGAGDLAADADLGGGRPEFRFLG